MPNPLLAFLEDRYEIPACDCVVEAVPFCTRVWSGGCSDRQRNGSCDHALWRAPCEHVFHADDAFYEDDWSAPFLDHDGQADDLTGLQAAFLSKLQAAAPAEFRRPRPAPPLLFKNWEARIAAMANRHDAGLELFSAGDMQEHECDEVSEEGRRGRNGAARRVGLTTAPGRLAA